MHDLVIIGGGIAGQTAAIYAARKRMDFVLLAAQPGGQFLQSGKILNYPGIIQTSGAEFSSLMDKQLEFNQVRPVNGVDVQRVERIKGGFKVIADRESYETRTVIIATGARPKKLGVPGEDQFLKKGVTYCSVCDGPLFSGKDIAIVGGGDAALEALEFTKDIANKIYLIVKGPDFTAHEYLIENLKAMANVEVILCTDTKAIIGDRFVTGLRYEKDGEEHTIAVQGVIIEIGRLPNTEFVKEFIYLDEHQHIMIDCQGKTNVPGVFAAGDCASGHEYQYVIAAGQGAMALLKAARYLAEVPK